jgi:hypothetical protein
MMVDKRNPHLQMTDDQIYPPYIDIPIPLDDNSHQSHKQQTPVMVVVVPRGGKPKPCDAIQILFI